MLRLNYFDFGGSISRDFLDSLFDKRAEFSAFNAYYIADP